MWRNARPLCRILDLGDEAKALLLELLVAEQARFFHQLQFLDANLHVAERVGGCCGTCAWGSCCFGIRNGRSALRLRLGLGLGLCDLSDAPD